jgi:hypothetical protein
LLLLVLLLLLLVLLLLLLLLLPTLMRLRLPLAPLLRRLLLPLPEVGARRRVARALRWSSSWVRVVAAGSREKSHSTCQKKKKHTYTR